MAGPGGGNGDFADSIRREDWCDMMGFARHVALSFMFFREMCGGEVEGAKITP